MARILSIFVLGIFMFAIVGCEAHGHVNKESAKVEVDKK